VCRRNRCAGLCGVTDSEESSSKSLSEGGTGVRTQWAVYLATAMLAGAAGGTVLGPAPVGAVAREIVELQQDVQQLMQGQKDLQTAIAQNSAVQKTLLELSLDSVSKLSVTMGTLQKSVQEMQANSGARLDTMSTQVQGLSDNLQEMQARMGKLNQLLTDALNAIQGIDAKLAGSTPTPAVAPGGKVPKGYGTPSDAPLTGH
jgi:chaperonin cofactor prefoldin